MQNYTFPIQFEYGSEMIILSEEELREAGFFTARTDLERELVLWDLADRCEVGIDCLW